MVEVWTLEQPSRNADRVDWGRAEFIKYSSFAHGRQFEVQPNSIRRAGVEELAHT